MKKFEIKDKIVLVTGANRGIGEAYVLELLNAGAKKIYAAARDTSNLHTLVENTPAIIEPILLDVTNPLHINALVEKIDALDILINNAGIINTTDFISDNTLEIARMEMETNYFAPLQLILALLPLLKQSKQAAIINLSSIAGISNFPLIAPYSATKAAMHSLTQGLRANLADQDITVVGVYPGPIETRMTDGWEAEKAKPLQVAQKTFEALLAGNNDVFPDEFSQQMYTSFLEHPKLLEKTFAEF